MTDTKALGERLLDHLQACLGARRRAAHTNEPSELPKARADLENWLTSDGAGMKIVKSLLALAAAGNQAGVPSDAQVEAATRAFLRVIKPSLADGPTDHLNAVDLDDSDFQIMDAMRAALAAVAGADPLAGIEFKDDVAGLT